jgi:hypothetical protein
VYLQCFGSAAANKLYHLLVLERRAGNLYLATFWATNWIEFDYLNTYESTGADREGAEEEASEIERGEEIPRRSPLEKERACPFPPVQYSI